MYEPFAKKVTMLSEFNAFIRKEQKNASFRSLRQKVEANSRLVIGGQGAWSKLLVPIVLEEYGSGMNTHDITSIISLLRIVRNIIQHPEHKKSMLAMHHREI